MSNPYTSTKQTNMKATRITSMNSWNNVQMEILSKVVLDEAGFISTFNETMVTKWDAIRNRLINSPGKEFKSCIIAQSEGLYNQYKILKRDMIKYYEIDPDSMDFSEIVDLKPWQTLILHMEKYRKITNQVSYHMLLR